MRESGSLVEPSSRAQLDSSAGCVGTGTDSVGAMLVRLLERNGVRHVFGIPGTHNLEIYRGLAQSAITHVTVRHEQGAAYAADGYSRSLGGPGVVVTTSGPALLNAAAGLATAYADSVPVLAISPGPPRGQERRDRGWLHEVKDQRSAMDNIVERSVRCESAEHLAAAVDGTFARWAVERTRPVHIEVPVDVLEEPAPGQLPPAPPPIGLGVDALAVAAAVPVIDAAERPMILVGGGAWSAADAVRTLAERLGAPVITTTGGKGTVPEGHPLVVGVSVPNAQDVLDDVDVLIVVGSELADADIRPESVRSKRLVRIDIDAAQLVEPVVPTVAILGDARQALELLIPRVASCTPGRLAVAHEQSSRLRERVRVSGAAEYAPLHGMLAGELGPDAIVCGDSSQVSYRGTAMQLELQHPRTFLYPNGFATLGYALPAAIGAKAAHPSRRVLALLGDGALMFSLQELATAAEQRSEITVILVDNGGYGEIRDQMREQGIGPIAVDLVHPDFVALARSFGWRADRAESLDDLATALASSRSAHGPRLLVTTPDAVAGDPHIPRRRAS